MYPRLTWRIKTSRKELYLTFDDGPVPGPTEFVLDLLRDHKIKATFFCIGQNISRNPSIFQRIVSEGHATGNHTFDHVNGWKVATNKYLDNVSACHKLMKDTTLFRPPYGRITPSAIRKLQGYRIIMWDVLTYDFSADTLPEQSLKGALEATRPGSIVVFHDSYKAEKNLTYVLPRYIDDCLGKGFEFKTL
jgi:peptidoglycan/xylan/chitin deacetylase (PgdA/CDA1 family)